MLETKLFNHGRLPHNYQEEHFFKDKWEVGYVPSDPSKYYKLGTSIEEGMWKTLCRKAGYPSLAKLYHDTLHKPTKTALARPVMTGLRALPALRRLADDMRTNDPKAVISPKVLFRELAKWFYFPVTNSREVENCLCTFEHEPHWFSREGFARSFKQVVKAISPKKKSKKSSAAEQALALAHLEQNNKALDDMEAEAKRMEKLATEVTSVALVHASAKKAVLKSNIRQMRLLTPGESNKEGVSSSGKSSPDSTTLSATVSSNPDSGPSDSVPSSVSSPPDSVPSPPGDLAA